MEFTSNRYRGGNCLKRGEGGLGLGQIADLKRGGGRRLGKKEGDGVFERMGCTLMHTINTCFRPYDNIKLNSHFSLSRVEFEAMVNLFSSEKKDFISVSKYPSHHATLEKLLLFENILFFLPKHFRFCFTLEVTCVFFFLIL